MLASIHIKNYAIIESIELDFYSNFNVITGETGAGKSILLGALGLILGKRADSQVLRNKDEKCIIEAHFNIENHQLQYFFDENDIEYDNICIIRREIAVNGKSRAFINDTPVNLDTLQALTAHLVDIHAQGETQKLLDEFYFCSILDKMAEQETETDHYTQTFNQYKSLQKKLNGLIEEKNQLQKEYDFNLFVYNEFENIDLEDNTYQNLEQELALQQNAELILQNLQNIDVALDANEFSILSQLTQANKQLNTISEFSTVFSEAKAELEQILDSLKSIHKQLNHEACKIEYQPEKLDSLQEQISVYNKLMQKHQVKSIDELLNVKNSYKSKIDAYTNHDELINDLEQQIKNIEKELNAQAKKISKNRLSKVASFEKELSSILQQIGMPFAKVEFQVSETKLNSKGIDAIQLLFSPNKGIPTQSLQQVGSGGEKSRLMLAIKSLTAQTVALPTLIFDEIDTGISGEVANKVADLLKQIGQQHQLIAITHLPQVAAKANHQFFVYKQHDKAVTYTSIKELSETERVHEIAVMLSGENPNKAAIENAKILMQ